MILSLDVYTIYQNCYYYYSSNCKKASKKATQNDVESQNENGSIERYDIWLSVCMFSVHGSE